MRWAMLLVSTSACGATANLPFQKATFTLLLSQLVDTVSITKRSVRLIVFLRLLVNLYYISSRHKYVDILHQHPL